MIGQLFPPSPRMKGFVHFAQLLVGDVGINLGGGDGRMTEHRLDRSDVGAVN